MILATRPAWRPAANGVARNDVDDLLVDLHRHESRRDGHHVGVVVLACQACELRVGHVGRAHADDLVGGDGHADAGAAHQHAEVGLAGGHLARRADREIRIVDGLLAVCGADVDDGDAGLGEVLGETLLLIESRMVAADDDAHEVSLSGLAGVECRDCTATVPGLRGETGHASSSP